MVPAPSPEGLPDLLPRIAAGDASAVSAVVARYKGLIWSLARRSDPDNLEDAVQEVFIDLWRAAPRFDATKASETTFVAMIARRRLIDRARHRRRQPVGVPEHAAAQITDDRQDPHQAALAGQTLRALTHLRPEQREVVLLCTQGWSHADVAAKTGLPLGTVKAHARRGLLAVRAVLGPDGDEP